MTVEISLPDDEGADLAEISRPLIHEYMTEMWDNMRRCQLLRAKPEKLNAFVYELIEETTVSHESERPIEKHLAELQKIAAKAPKGCKVVIEFDQESDYDGGYYTKRRIGFYRLPTAEEVEERKALNAEIREVQAESRAKAAEEERAEFERLKAKFEK